MNARFTEARTVLVMTHRHLSATVDHIKSIERRLKAKELEVPEEVERVTAPGGVFSEIGRLRKILAGACQVDPSKDCEFCRTIVALKPRALLKPHVHVALPLRQDVFLALGVFSVNNCATSSEFMVAEPEAVRDVSRALFERMTHFIRADNTNSLVYSAALLEPESEVYFVRRYKRTSYGHLKSKSRSKPETKQKVVKKSKPILNRRASRSRGGR